MSAETTPAVSVVMPVFNAAATIADSIRSILDQDFGDFEFLIIDDGSSDNSPEIVRGFSDKRIRLLVNDRNMGVAASLNRGLAIARGEYIARQDADDISLPLRLSRQVCFLDEHTKVGVAGSWATTFGSEHQQIVLPVKSEEIRSQLIFNSALIHPTVMMRKAFLRRYQLQYDPEAAHAEDYDFWVRCSRHFRLANAGEFLVKYRVHESQVGARHSAVQAKTASLIRSRLLTDLGLSDPAQHLALLEKLGTGTALTRKDLQEVKALLQLLLDINAETARYERSAFAAVVRSHWYSACKSLSEYVTPATPFLLFLSSPLRKGAGLRNIIRLFRF